MSKNEWAQLNLSTWILWLALAVGVALACRQQPVSQFPHKLHMVDLHCGSEGQPECLSCTSCHKSQTGHNPPLTPTAEACTQCHKNDGAQQLQAVSQSQAGPPLAHSIRFSHDIHLKMSGIQGQCVGCHREVAGDNGKMFPTMADCFSCHEHQAQFDNGQCGPCHDGHDVKKLKPVTFMVHDAQWLRSHARQASMGAAICSSCHAERECVDCHNTAQVLSVEKRRPDAFDSNFAHSGDFLTRHALEAQMNSATCARCHTPQSCDACHLERGVSGNSMNARSPHPPGFMGSNYAAPEFHGRSARRDIVACAGCHDQGAATNCISCHRVGASGGNPHPRGWMSAGTNPQQGMCRYCHE